jgi:uncharacterized OsmC-like protein
MEIMSTTSIRDALEKISSVFTADPEKARSKGVPATARLVDGLRFDVTGPSGENARTDMPRAMGGGGSEPSPGWLLRGAIASCTATVMAMRAAQLGIDLTTLEVTVESESDQRGMIGVGGNVSAAFNSLRILVRIGAEGVAPDDLRALVTWGDVHSPVACTVRQTPVTSMEVEIV